MSRKGTYANRVVRNALAGCVSEGSAQLRKAEPQRQQRGMQQAGSRRGLKQAKCLGRQIMRNEHK